TPLARRGFVSVYYDTRDRRLAGQGVTLRRRLEGRKHRWQLELPHDGSRIDLGVSGTGDPTPDQGRKLLPVYARGAELVAIATLTTRRSGVLVRDVDGPAAEVALDRVSVVDGDRAAQRFGEVEIQLLRNDEDTLRRLGIILEASGATPDTGRPTLFRALGLD